MSKKSNDSLVVCFSEKHVTIQKVLNGVQEIDKDELLARHII